MVESDNQSSIRIVSDDKTKTHAHERNAHRPSDHSKQAVKSKHVFDLSGGKSGAFESTSTKAQATHVDESDYTHNSNHFLQHGKHQKAMSENKTKLTKEAKENLPPSDRSTKLEFQ